VKSKEAFKRGYPQVDLNRVYGDFNGTLDNKGDILTIFNNALGSIVLE
jgi:hypothetical protein